MSSTAVLRPTPLPALFSSSPSNPPSPSSAPELPSLTLSALTRYTKLEKLGEGNYGQVYKARDNQTDRIVALKKIKFDSEDDGVPSTALREISVLQDIRHSNVVPLLDVIYGADHLYLSFPFYDKDVRRYMDCVGELHPMCVKYYVWQILAGLHHCHQHRILHRDLKPQNVLVNRSGHITLADFGLARTVAAPHNATITHEVATLWYRSPEILMGAHCYTAAMDMWSVGCMLAELTADMPLFAGESEIATIFKIFQFTGTPSATLYPTAAQLPDYHATFPQWRPLSVEQLHVRFPQLDVYGIDLLQRLLAVDPECRVSAGEALTHPYFADLDVAWAVWLSEQASVQLDFNDGTERRRRRHARR